MCSAGLLNGTRICEDTALLTDTLRGAWGFAGAVLAEPGAVQDPARTLAAGVDFAPADAGRLVDAVQSGALDESVLNRAASNIIRTLLAASTQPSPRTVTAPQTAVWLSSWPSRAVCSCAIWAHCRCTRGRR
ncbi:hypothetical protein NIA69_03410 [Gemmiger formicilis]|nr:hypothetical protein [Gemmiger formicilis]